ncbi:redox-sensitive transcriptional activator SoxR [Thalassotalea crassostreae]|uniref:redox-sensitive transcriptional activator SoxR n=1 Tax=Thalassotalea crassostreae TaxID=1763536 RepID=UPI000838A71A|nr:redox-sensitive transcriptional activator SoxR [Thalassotalea crassostreae]
MSVIEEATLSVGYVAKRCGIKVSALHFYEQKGLIRSWRNQGNQRRYKRDVLRRISVIKAAQKMGISLGEVKTVFEQLPNNRTPNKNDWGNLAKIWQETLEQRIRYLENLRDSLTGCIGCGCLSMTNCPIYNANDELGKEASGAVILNRSL